MPVNLTAQTDKGAVTVELERHFVGDFRVQGTSSTGINRSDKLGDLDGKHRSIRMETKKHGWTTTEITGRVERDGAPDDVLDRSSATVVAVAGRARINFE